MAGKKGGAKDDASDDKEDPEAAETEDGDGDEDGKDEDGKDKDRPEEPPSARAGYIGLGLVGSLVVGFDPLRDAFQGNGSFENAIFRFLACVAVCVVGAGTIGRLIDASAPDPEAQKEPQTDDDGTTAGGDSARGATAELPESAAGAPKAGGELPTGDEDKQSISTGSAKSDETGRQENHQQPLTSSEETSR